MFQYIYWTELLSRSVGSHYDTLCHCPCVSLAVF